MASTAVQQGDVLAQLRAHLQRVAPMRAPSVRLPTGVPSLDIHTRGWPRPGLAVIRGRVGSGRLRLVLPSLGRLSRSGRTVAMIDPVGTLHPPGLTGVALEHLLVVRSGAGRATWCAEQLARCAALPLIVLIDPPPLRRAGRRLLHAAEAGDCTLIIVSDAPQRGVPASLEIETLSSDLLHIHRGACHGRRRISGWAPSGSDSHNLPLLHTAQRPNERSFLLRR